ncbi:MAG: GntR family transcriptional regulator [Planctomycetota bacterium]|jgi:DNA-binding GntR family transcriptional regulator
MEDGLPTKTSSQPLSDRIHDYLREAIIKNEIKPRNIIREKDIATVFNSSTTPVREAIKRLASEGFVEVHPYRHAIVSEITNKEYEEISETMYVLDSYAHKIIIHDLTEKNHQELRGMTLELEKFCTIDTLEKYLKLNADIHIYVWEFLKNEFLYAMIRQAFDKFLHSHRHTLYTQWTRNDASLKKSLRLHKKITEALIEKDTAHICSIIKKHWYL